jgi:integrase
VDVCNRISEHYKRVAGYRYDPTERLEKSRLYAEAARRISSGKPIDDLGLPGLPDAATRQPHQEFQVPDSRVERGISLHSSMLGAFADLFDLPVLQVKVPFFRGFLRYFVVSPTLDLTILHKNYDNMVSADVFSNMELTMPASYEMSWDARNRRWHKMHRGQRFVVSCRQLRTPETKEGSYHQANIWWRQKLSEIESQATSTLYQPIIQALEDQKVREQEQGKDTSALDFTINHYKTDPRGDIITELVPFVFGEEYRPERPKPDQTTVHHVRRYIDLELARVNSGQLSSSEFGLCQLYLRYLVEWIGDKPIDKDTWHDYFVHVLSKAVSLTSKHKQLRYAKNLLRWLGEMGILTPLPTYVDSRKYRVNATVKEVPTMTVHEVKTILAASPTRLRVLLLLMMNCGFGQKDCADLRQSEVDWTKGTITRKRSKTKVHHENVPCVTWKLWASTFDLLKKFREKGDLVLLNDDGEPWVQEFMVGDKVVSRDFVANKYKYVRVKTGIDKPLKLIRKTSASLLETHELYGRYVLHFLADTPSGMAARHYVKPSQDRFDDAIEFLGSQYGAEVTG